MTAPLSVTVLTGSPGTDGERVLERILSGPADLRVTAIVPQNDRQQRSGQRPSVLSTTERLVRLGEGCACCTVRGDLLAKIKQIATEQSADHIVIQAAPHSDLVTLAKTFTVADDAGAVLSELARIEGLVAVVNARSLLTTLKSADARPLIERIELANVIVIEETSELAPKSAAVVLTALEALNPEARIERSDEKNFALSSLHVEQPFELNAAQRRSARPDHSIRSSSSIVQLAYHDRRPFHPTRLHALLDEPWAGVLRAQGTFWVASRPSFAGLLDVAGGSRITAAGGQWWAAVPPDQRPDSRAFQEYVDAIWHPAFGDRHQQLTIVGIDVDESALRDRLDQCLLTDEELAEPERWHALPHPFSWPENSA